MNSVLLITSGDSAGESLRQSGVLGELLVWHDLLYDGPPRRPAWPDEDILRARATFLEDATGGGLDRCQILQTLRTQYAKLGTAGTYRDLVLWFDACLFDQSMLAHILACLGQRSLDRASLICVDAFPGIEPFHGLGQLTPAQLASVADCAKPVTPEQFEFAAAVDRAFAAQDPGLVRELAGLSHAPLPWVPAAAARWLQEQPDPKTGLGRLERLALDAVRDGCAKPRDIFVAVARRDTPPQYWGDTTLWARINGLAGRRPPLVRIDGPLDRLPQWEGSADLAAFRVTALPQ